MAVANAGLQKGMTYFGIVLGAMLGIKFLAALLPGILSDINTTITSLTSYDASAGSLAGVVWIVLGIVVIVAGVSLVDKLSQR